MQYFQCLRVRSLHSQGAAGVACKVLIQVCDLEAKPPCVKRRGASKIEQERSIRVKMTVKVTETYSDLAVKAVCGCLTFQDILPEIKKKFFFLHKLMIFYC